MGDHLTVNLGTYRWRLLASLEADLRTSPLVRLETYLADTPPLRRTGKKRFYRVRVGASLYLLKHYTAGSLWRRSRARLEWERRRQAEERGIATVPAAGYVEWRRQSALLSPFLQGWRPLQEALHADSARQFGRFARVLHDRGVDQDDLNPTNVLSRNSSMLLVDFERVRILPVVPWPRRSCVLAKLLRPQSMGPELFESFLEGYLDRHDREDAARRDILQAAERLLRRDVKKIAARCVRENRTFGRIATREWTGFYRRDSGLDPIRPIEPCGGGRREWREKVLDEWRRANMDHVRGGERPIAVGRRPGEKGGWILYAAEARPR